MKSNLNSQGELNSHEGVEFNNMYMKHFFAKAFILVTLCLIYINICILFVLMLDAR